MLASMRDSVADQILAFRDAEFLGKKRLLCPIAGESITRNGSHVDHVFPRTFLALANDWLIGVNLSFDQIQLMRSADGYGWALADFEQTSSWQSFHRINAVLRVVSRRANLSELQRLTHQGAATI